MIVINRMAADSSTRPAAEQIELLAERRLFLKRRWRGVAADGTEFGFDLEARLKHGAVIHQTPNHDYVIHQELETVYEIRPTSADEAALMGWKIGNLHFPVQIVDGVLRVTCDPAIQQLLEREAWPFETVTVVFNPLRVTAHAS